MEFWSYQYRSLVDLYYYAFQIKCLTCCKLFAEVAFQLCTCGSMEMFYFCIYAHAGGAHGCGHARFSTSCLHQRARLLRPIGRKGRCWFPWLTLSLLLPSQLLSPCTFTLRCPFTSPLPLASKNLWLLGFEFNHCLLTSPLWHSSMFSCCRAPFFFIFTQRDCCRVIWTDLCAYPHVQLI